MALFLKKFATFNPLYFKNGFTPKTLFRKLLYAEGTLPATPRQKMPDKIKTDYFNNGFTLKALYLKAIAW